MSSCGSSKSPDWSDYLVSGWIVQKTLDNYEASKKRLRVPTEGVYMILRALGGMNYRNVYNGKAVDITLKNINHGKSFTSTLKRIGQHYFITLPECYGYNVGDEMKLRFNEDDNEFDYLIIKAV